MGKKKKFGKKSLLINDQINLLIQRNLIVNDLNQAQLCLETVGYYRLSAYFKPFLVENNGGDHLFKSGTTFEQIWQIYVFDRELRLHLSDALERIEIALRAALTNVLSDKYGNLWYLSEDPFQESWIKSKLDKTKKKKLSSHQFFIKEIKKICKDKADRLANIFYQLHSIPSNKFTYLESENFDIQYATGLLSWVNHEIKITNKKYADAMISILDEKKEQLIDELENLKQWKEEYSKKQTKYVITHGDAHHYNVLQTDTDLLLVDWDGLKIAPIERDLWHYENMLLIDEYNTLNPDYKIDIKLCHFYRLQRFFEDLHYYLTQVLQGKNSTEHQSIEDKDTFLTHWGWKICLPA